MWWVEKTFLVKLSDNFQRKATLKSIFNVAKNTELNLPQMVSYYKLFPQMHVRTHASMYTYMWYNIKHCKTFEIYQHLIPQPRLEIRTGQQSAAYKNLTLTWDLTGLVSSGVSLTSKGEGAFLALVGHPSNDGVTIKIPYAVDVLLYRPSSSHPIFSHWVDQNWI